VSAGPSPEQLQELWDKQAIHEVVMRYCRGIDRGDPELVRSCYHPDATDEHGSFFGTRDEYIEWVFGRMLPKFSMTYHFVANHLVDRFSATTARSEAYGISWHQAVDPSNTASSLTSAFRYVDDVERRDGGPWLIARRVCTVEWVRHDDPALHFAPSPRHRRGTRDHADPVFWPFGEHVPWPGGPTDPNAVR
jgi:hypothetical protein